MNVSDFKKIVAQWPEYNTRIDEPAEVWVQTGPFLSSQLKACIPLNVAADGSCDMLLAPDPTTWPNAKPASHKSISV